MEKELDYNSLIVKTLKELGFEPQKYDDLGYVFDMEGIHILYIGDEDTPSFIRFAVPSIFDITDENRAEITGIMYELTKELKYVKAFDINDSVWISYEHCLVSPEELETLVAHIIYSLQHSLVYFNDKLTGGWSSDDSGTETEDIDKDNGGDRQ